MSEQDSHYQEINRFQSPGNFSNHTFRPGAIKFEILKSSEILKLRRSDFLSTNHILIDVFYIDNKVEFLNQIESGPYLVYLFLDIQKSLFRLFVNTMCEHHNRGRFFLSVEQTFPSLRYHLTRLKNLYDFQTEIPRDENLAGDSLDDFQFSNQEIILPKEGNHIFWDDYQKSQNQWKVIGPENILNPTHGRIFLQSGDEEVFSSLIDIGFNHSGLESKMKSPSFENLKQLLFLCPAEGHLHHVNALSLFEFLSSTSVGFSENLYRNFYKESFRNKASLYKLLRVARWLKESGHVGKPLMQTIQEIVMGYDHRLSQCFEPKFGTVFTFGGIAQNRHDAIIEFANWIKTINNSWKKVVKGFLSKRSIDEFLNFGQISKKDCIVWGLTGLSSRGSGCTLNFDRIIDTPGISSSFSHQGVNGFVIDRIQSLISEIDSSFIALISMFENFSPLESLEPEHHTKVHTEPKKSIFEILGKEIDVQDGFYLSSVEGSCGNLIVHLALIESSEIKHYLMTSTENNELAFASSKIPGLKVNQVLSFLNTLSINGAVFDR